jgi:hypothetical protein
VSEGRTTPGGQITAVPWNERFTFALFIADPNGGICTAGGDPQTGFGPWASVSEGRTTPGGQITAVPNTGVGGGPLTLFITDPNGGIYTASGDPQAGFGPWSFVPGITTAPGSPVTAVGWYAGLSLFVTDINGGIFTTAGVPHENRWQRWSQVEGVTAPPGAPVTFLPYDMDPDLTPSEVNGTTPLFVTDIHGTIYATDEGGNLWSPVSNGKAAPGSPLTAVYDGNTTITLFVTAGDGTIWTNESHELGVIVGLAVKDFAMAYAVLRRGSLITAKVLIKTDHVRRRRQTCQTSQQLPSNSLRLAKRVRAGRYAKRIARPMRASRHKPSRWLRLELSGNTPTG